MPKYSKFPMEHPMTAFGPVGVSMPVDDDVDLQTVVADVELWIENYKSSWRLPRVSQGK
jgi:hypothetical protein